MNKAKRQKALKDLLSDGNEYTNKELSTILGVSVATITNDLKAIKSEPKSDNIDTSPSMDDLKATIKAYEVKDKTKVHALVYRDSFDEHTRKRKQRPFVQTYNPRDFKNVLANPHGYKYFVISEPK